MWITEKINSRYHWYKTYFYKKSSAWKKHPLNINLPFTDFVDVDKQLHELSREMSFRFFDFKISREEYFKFKNLAGTSPLYAIGNKEKKISEHFISYKLLDLKRNDTYIDIASENSPFPEIFRKKMGVISYSQDIKYKSGIHGFKIGSGADSLPVPDTSVDSMSLQCAFEHFAQDIDIRFIFEARRVLKKNGKCCIVPLYLSSQYLNIVDPLMEYKDVWFGEGAMVVAETNLGGVFERVYSVKSLKRILIPDIGLRYSIYKICHQNEITGDRKSSVFRVRYALLIEKVGEDFTSNPRRLPK